MKKSVFLLTNFYFLWQTKNKKYPALIHSLRWSTNAKIHLFNYVLCQNKRNVYFVTHGEEKNLCAPFNTQTIPWRPLATKPQAWEGSKPRTLWNTAPWILRLEIFINHFAHWKHYEALKFEAAASTICQIVCYYSQCYQ